MYLCSCLLLTIHECDKSWFLYATPIHHTYGGYSIMHYNEPLYMTKLCIGKGHRVINYNLQS